MVRAGFPFEFVASVEAHRNRYSHRKAKRTQPSVRWFSVMADVLKGFQHKGQSTDTRPLYAEVASMGSRQ